MLSDDCSLKQSTLSHTHDPAISSIKNQRGRRFPHNHQHRTRKRVQNQGGETSVHSRDFPMLGRRGASMPTIIYTPIDAPKPCGRAPIRHDTHRDQRRHHEPKVRPHTQRSQTYGHDTHTRRWLVLTIEGCPEGNRSNRPQIRYPNTLPHTGRRRELISSGTTFIDVPRPAHESQRYKACCKRPKDPTHRRDRTGRLVCAPSAGSRAPPPDMPQRAARRRRSPHIPPIRAPQHLATQYPNTIRLPAADPAQTPARPRSQNDSSAK